MVTITMLVDGQVKTGVLIDDLAPPEIDKTQHECVGTAPTPFAIDASTRRLDRGCAIAASVLGQGLLVERSNPRTVGENGPWSSGSLRSLRIRTAAWSSCEGGGLDPRTSVVSGAPPTPGHLGGALGLSWGCCPRRVRGIPSEG